MTSLHDLRFRPPPNSKSRLRLCIKPCAICIPDHMHTCDQNWSLHLSIVGAFSRAVAYNIAKVQSNKIYIRCIASSLKFLWYGSRKWNMEKNFRMEWNMEWKIFGMEWKKINSMEYENIVFHSLPCSSDVTHGQYFKRQDELKSYLIKVKVHISNSLYFQTIKLTSNIFRMHTCQYA